MDKGYVLITGASSGIGKEIAILFAKKKRNLVIVSQNEKKLRQIAEELMGKYKISIEVLAVNLAKIDAGSDIYHRLYERSIHVDTLVNNAGVGIVGRFDKNDWVKELNMLKVNILALTELTKYFLPDMKERGYGSILNIGSTGSFVAGPMNAVYCATKAYVLSFSEAIAEELAGTGVKVACLCPGATETGFAAYAGAEKVRLFKSGVLSASKVAQEALKALEKGKPVKVVGVINQIQILFTRFIPRKLIVKISKYMMS